MNCANGPKPLEAPPLTSVHRRVVVVARGDDPCASMTTTYRSPNTNHHHTTPFGRRHHHGATPTPCAARSTSIPLPSHATTHATALPHAPPPRHSHHSLTCAALQSLTVCKDVMSTRVSRQQPAAATERRVAGWPWGLVGGMGSHGFSTLLPSFHAITCARVSCVSNFARRASLEEAAKRDVEAWASSSGEDEEFEGVSLSTHLGRLGLERGRRASHVFM